MPTTQMNNIGFHKLYLNLFGFCKLFTLSYINVIFVRILIITRMQPISKRGDQTLSVQINEKKRTIFGEELFRQEEGWQFIQGKGF